MSDVVVNDLSQEDLERHGRSMEAWSAAEVLGWAAERFPSRITFATGLGTEGCVLIDLIGRHRLPIDLFTLDTGLLFPETYALRRRLEQRYGATLRSSASQCSRDTQS